MAERAPIKILLADDEESIQTLLTYPLEKDGYEVIVASDGREALDHFAHDRFDLVILDVMMPRLDGYQTGALIKNNSEFRATPVIMLSSKDGLFDKAKGRIVGSDQYLTKPFSRNELIGAIQQHVRAGA